MVPLPKDRFRLLPITFGHAACVGSRLCHTDKSLCETWALNWIKRRLEAVEIPRLFFCHAVTRFTRGMVAFLPGNDRLTFSDIAAVTETSVWVYGVCVSWLRESMTQGIDRSGSGTDIKGKFSRGSIAAWLHSASLRASLSPPQKRSLHILQTAAAQRTSSSIYQI